MVKIADRIRRENLQVRLIMQVHDELVLECPDQEIGKVDAMLHEIMEHIVEWDIPMAVEVGSGKNWLDAKK